MAIGIYVAGVIGVCYLQRIDWNYEAERTLKRLSSTFSTQHAREASLPLRTESFDEGQ